MWLSHTQKLFFPHSCACQHLHCPYFFWCKVFPLRAAVVCRNDKQADDSETARRKQKLQAWGYRKCHHHSVLLGDKLHTFSYAPTNIWQYFKALHKAVQNEHMVCLFVCLFKWAILKFEPFSKPFLSVAQSRHLTLLRQGRFLISQQWKLAADSH